MKEYLVVLSPEYSWLYVLLAWVYHLFTLVIIFSPLFIVAKKWKPARWWHVVGATILAFLIFLLFYWIIDNNVIQWSGWAKYVGNYGKFTGPFDNIWGAKGLVISTLLFSLSPFYSIWLIYRQYNWRRFFLALGFSLLVLALMAAYQIYVFFLGLAAFARYFN